MYDILLDVQNKLGGSFDIKMREIPCSAGTITLLYIANLSNVTDISHYLVAPLSQQCEHIIDKQKALQALHVASVFQVSTSQESIEHIVKGDCVVFFPFLDYIVACEVKHLESRRVEKPETDAALRGPKESFNERLVDNLSLIRKRITSADLKVEAYTLGTRSNTAAALLYLNSTVPPELLDLVRLTLINLKIDSILSITPIAEELRSNFTTIETTGYTERPDKVVSGLFEGRVAVLVNGSPFALTAPSFFIENFHSPDDSYSNNIESSLLRILRILAFAIALTLPALFIALTTQNISLLPTTFMFKLASARAGVPFPTVIELLLMQFFFELSREAGKRLPEKIGQSLSVVAGLILGQSAVDLGLASPATVVVTGVYAICSFINPRLISTTLLWSVLITSASAMFALHGFYLSFVCFLAQMASLRSCGYPYLFPLGTVKEFRYKGRDMILRSKLKRISLRILQRGQG